MIRIDPALHAALRDGARRQGISLNEYCARKLAWPGGERGEPATAAVARAVHVLGDALVGVVAFGSWAREEMSDGSDVDLLVVAAEAVPIERDLYRRWDAEPVTWRSYPVDAHFVRLPARGEPVSALWAEAAVDGVVLYDRDLALSRWLVEVRRRIVAGEIARRWANGQPYWVEAA